jgi:hypothetical protein
MSVLRVLLIVLIAQGAFAQQASLQGRVLKSGTAEPIAKVSLELRRADVPNAQPFIATTADDGRFVFRNLQPGRYQLFATRNGYVPAEYGQRRPNGPGLHLTIAADRPLPDVQLTMIATGAITGRISDRAGQPLVNADVQALRATYQDGRRVLTLVQSARTNDLGEYRIFWLPPGQYYVQATPWDGTPLGSSVVMNPGAQPGGSGGARFSVLVGDRIPPGFRPGAPPSETEAWVPIFFPGTPNEETATPIDVRSSANFAGVDITLSPVRPRRVRGVVLDATGQSARSAQLMRSRAAATANGYWVDQVDAATGAFDIRGVIPGSYTLVAVAAGFTGRVAIEVAEKDLEDVTIAVAPGIDVSGHVTIEGRPPASGVAEFAGLRVSVRTDPLIPGMPQPYAGPAADGAFAIQRVLPGDYRVTIQPFQNQPVAAMLPSLIRQVTPTTVSVSPAVNPLQPPPMLPPPSPSLQNAYVKSIRLGNADVLNAGLRLDRVPEQPLEIVIGSDGGTIDGIVMNDRREPVSNVPVALVPNAARRVRTDLFKSATTDPGGRFRLQGIAPGEYKLFSWEDAENGAWLFAEFLRLYEEVGKPIQIREGSEENVEIAVIPPRN